MAYAPQDGWPGIIGLDLAKQTFKGCRLSEDGYTKRRNFSGKMTMDGEGFWQLLEYIESGDLVIMEAGSSSFNLARFLIMNTEAEIVVLNPAQLRIIWDSQRKTDKADAMKLACIGRDMRREAWPVVSVPSAQEQCERSAVSYHVFLKKDQTSKYNRFFALFNGLGYPDIDKRRCKDDKAYRHALVDNLLPEPAKAMGESLNKSLDLLAEQLEEVKKQLVEICLAHPVEAISWLSIPGIGLVNAATLIAYIGDGSRFSKVKQLLNYVGLVPKVNQSGESSIHGRVTKRGVTCVRRNIIQGAAVVIRNYNSSCPLSKFAYRKTMELKCFGKVSVAVACKMLKIGLSLLRHRDIYCTAKQDGCMKLKAKLIGYNLSALIDYLPQ